jgi:ADP-ribose pyrophosphatase
MNSPGHETLYRGKFLALVKEEHWEYVERVNATGVVVIIAVTGEQKLLLVEQYRIPLHSRTIELPQPKFHHEGLSAASRNQKKTDRMNRIYRIKSLGGCFAR